MENNDRIVKTVRGGAEKRRNERGRCAHETRRNRGLPERFFLISDSARSRLRVPASIDARPMIDECLVVVSDGYPTGGIRLG